MNSTARSLAFTLFHGLRPGDDLLARMRRAARYQVLPVQAQREQELGSLRALLAHIKRHVPYYRDVLPGSVDACVGMGPGRIEWGAVPLLDKAIIRRAGEAMRSTSPGDRGLANATSGSTGESLRFFLDADSRTSRAATTYRFQRWAGIEPWDRQAKLWGARFDAPKSGLRHDLTQFLHPILFLSSYELSTELMEEYTVALRRFRPALLVSYPTPLEHFARFCRERGYRFESLRAITCSAEQLLPHQRQVVEDALGCPVFDRYGSREFSNVAQECAAHAGLHLATDHVHLEILRPDGRPVSGDETGEVVITDLHNRAMPFLRYRTGDLARWSDGPCGCGRTLPRIAGLEGRVFELVRAPGGEVISGTFWPQIVKQASVRVRFYQVVQEDPSSIEMRLVMDPPGALDAEEEQRLFDPIRKHAPSLAVRVVYVDEIPLTPGGKRRTVIGLPAAS